MNLKNGQKTIDKNGKYHPFMIDILNPENSYGLFYSTESE